MTEFHLIAPRSRISREMREARQPHRGMVFWLTGLSGSGKSTLAHHAEAALFREGWNIIVLDGDAIRAGLCAGLGFTPEDRRENNRRIAEAAKLFACAGVVCLCAFISPEESVRRMARDIVGSEQFQEVFVSCSVEECERRDVKGFYRMAREGKIKNFTGISAGYEIPVSPDCAINTEGRPVEESAAELLAFVGTRAAKTRP
ncbi:MAG: adenylyl-sulfate kinase [Desulfovibrio sp.]|jgi:adenylyl-sulfate kinase|nr:adenylyl-sulfate kinase [Desulfovibrio sp.]